MKPEPKVLDVDGAAARIGEERPYSRLERRTKLGDDLVLVPEVIIEIAGADVHLARDLGCRDLRCAAPIEQGEAGLENALARAAGSLFLDHG